MDTKKADKKNMLERFDDITLEQIHSNVNAAKEFLLEEGLDPEKELEHGLKQIKKLQFLAKAKLNKAKDEGLLEMAFAKLKQSISDNAQKTGDILRGFLQSKNPALQYRKLEKWTDEEIRDVLQDIDLVQLLEELEKDC